MLTVKEEGVATRTGHDKRKERATASGGEGRVDNRAMKGKERALVMTAIVGTTTAVAGGTTLNSLITKVISDEIKLSDSGATMGTLLIRAILTWLYAHTLDTDYIYHLC